MPIESVILLKRRNHRVGIVEIGGQIRIQVGLIAFDGQGTGSRVRMSDLHEVSVGRPRIRRVDAWMPRQARQDRFGDGDLVGFL